jgi:hypothetical protein
MCQGQELYEQKFGYQRAAHYTGVSEAQKDLNTFDKHVYFPTNWRNNYAPLMSKFPEFLRYGGLVSVAPEYLQKNYLGIYPIGQQPLVNEPLAYEVPRLS